MSDRGALTGRIRLAALLALGAYAVHQLRYLAAYGADGSAQLARQGHGYLEAALPVLAAFALAVAAATVIGAMSASRPRAAGGIRRALTCAAALLTIFFAQELIEGSLAAGHPAGLAALVAGGGWLALPLALAIGAAVAALLRLLEGAERVLATLLLRPRGRRRAPARRGRPLAARRLTPLRSPLAFGLSRRPPPSLA
jgi:hypothetical protein